jgi:2-amino-4-hydroxy-6-hydroxymethyldihydropteridine diphosphokinase
MPQALAYIGLGANLGDAAAAVLAAAQALGRLPHIQLLALSPLYQSAPVDAAGPTFINAVACVQTRRPPEALLADLLALEHRFGRERPYHHAPRTLDLDLLFHGSARIETPTLTLPHPRWAERAFVVRPLMDLLPEGVAPDGTVIATLQPALEHQPIERVSP